MKLKWKNPRRGEFRCGPWVIHGEKKYWQLNRIVAGKEIKVFDGRRKSICQDYANDHPDAGLPPKPKPEPKPKVPDNDNLGSILASLRLDICALAEMIGVLATEIRELRLNRG